MLKVERSVTLKAAPDAVWKVMGNFGDMSWHPAAKGTTVEEKDGAKVRTIDIGGGAAIVERQTGEAAGKSYSYTILTSPLPVANYNSTIALSAEGSGSRIDWSGSFDAAGASDDDAKNVIAGVYEGGLDALAKRFG